MMFVLLCFDIEVAKKEDERKTVSALMYGEIMPARAPSA